MAIVASAQVDLEREVIASGGTEYEGASLILTSTVGEVAVMSNFTAGLQLTEGYQQYFPDAVLTCLGDFNFDGVIDTLDLLIMLGSFGCESSCLVDMNGDDETNTLDLLAFLGVFGTACP